jgi:hypothetical protein
VGSIPITRSSFEAEARYKGQDTSAEAEVFLYLAPCILYLIFAHIAQSVEHFLGKEEVIGSIPIMGSSFWIDDSVNF